MPCDIRRTECPPLQAHGFYADGCRRESAASERHAGHHKRELRYCGASCSQTTNSTVSSNEMAGLEVRLIGYGESAYVGNIANQVGLSNVATNKSAAEVLPVYSHNIQEPLDISCENSLAVHEYTEVQYSGSHNSFPSNCLCSFATARPTRNIENDDGFQENVNPMRHTSGMGESNWGNDATRAQENASKQPLAHRSRHLADYNRGVETHLQPMHDNELSFAWNKIDLVVDMVTSSFSPRLQQKPQPSQDFVMDALVSHLLVLYGQRTLPFRAQSAKIAQCICSFMFQETLDFGFFIYHSSDDVTVTSAIEIDTIDTAPFDEETKRMMRSTLEMTHLPLDEDKRDDDNSDDGLAREVLASEFMEVSGISCEDSDFGIDEEVLGLMQHSLQELDLDRLDFINAHLRHSMSDDYEDGLDDEIDRLSTIERQLNEEMKLVDISHEAGNFEGELAISIAPSRVSFHEIPSLSLVEPYGCLYFGCQVVNPAHSSPVIPQPPAAANDEGTKKERTLSSASVRSQFSIDSVENIHATQSTNDNPRNPADARDTTSSLPGTESSKVSHVSESEQQQNVCRTNVSTEASAVSVQDDTADLIPNDDTESGHSVNGKYIRKIMTERRKFTVEEVFNHMESAQSYHGPPEEILDSFLDLSVGAAGDPHIILRTMSPGDSSIGVLRKQGCCEALLTEALLNVTESTDTIESEISAYLRKAGPDPDESSLISLPHREDLKADDTEDDHLMESTLEGVLSDALSDTYGNSDTFQDILNAEDFVASSSWHELNVIRSTGIASSSSPTTFEDDTISGSWLTYNTKSDMLQEDKESDVNAAFQYAEALLDDLLAPSWSFNSMDYGPDVDERQTPKICATNMENDELANMESTTDAAATPKFSDGVQSSTEISFPHLVQSLTQAESTVANVGSSPSDETMHPATKRESQAKTHDFVSLSFQESEEGIEVYSCESQRQENYGEAASISQDLWSRNSVVSHLHGIEHCNGDPHSDQNVFIQSKIQASPRSAAIATRLVKSMMDKVHSRERPDTLFTDPSDEGSETGQVTPRLVPTIEFGSSSSDTLRSVNMDEDFLSSWKEEELFSSISESTDNGSSEEESEETASLSRDTFSTNTTSKPSQVDLKYPVVITSTTWDARRQQLPCEKSEKSTLVEEDTTLFSSTQKSSFWPEVVADFFTSLLPVTRPSEDSTLDETE